MTVFRRVRAAATIALAWGVAWMLGAIGVFTFLFLRYAPAFNTYPQIVWGELVLAFSLFGLAWGAIGALNGFSFAMLLSGYGTRRSVRIRRLNVVLLGAAAGAILPLTMVGMLLPAELRGGAGVSQLAGLFGTIALGGSLGALSALGTFALAQHGALKDQPA